MPFGSWCSWDNEVEQTAVTSNPAAGVVSVDVKTFTGRGCVTYVTASSVADATVASRQLFVQKGSGGNWINLAYSAAYAASATGSIAASRGNLTAWGATFCALSHLEFGPGDILRVLASNGQAGDDMSAITYSYKEML